MKHSDKKGSFRSMDMSKLVSPRPAKAAKDPKLKPALKRLRKQEHRAAQANGPIVPGSGSALASQDI